MKRIRLASLACTLLAVLAINGTAQQGAALRVTGRVSGATRLSLGGPLSTALAGASASVQATAYEQGSEQIVITLSAPDQTGEASLSIPLEVRTNVAYELLAALTADACASTVTARVESVRASGLLTMNDAVERTRFSDAPVTFAAAGAALLEGPRVSKAGNFSTPTNALRINLVVRLSAAPQTGCAGKATLRLWLRPASL
ncbi:MAG TPA: hypothetical protein VKA60_26805 [Blastocatellia bacterium]|nr:hypothetical protein [Blastocatellia bacterium]